MESVGSIILYIIVALAMVLFSVLAVTTRKILRAATYLLFTLFAAACVYFMIAVYAGGIVVLFVFSILLTSRPGHNSERLTSKSRALGLIASIAMLAVSGYALVSRCALYGAMPAADTPTMQQVGQAMMSTSDGGYLLPFEAISVLLLACIIGGVVIARKR